MFPSWDSLPELQTFRANLVVAMIAIPVFAALVTAAIGLWQFRIDARIHEMQRAEAVKAKNRLDEAEQKVGEARERLAHRIESISGRQVEAFVAALKAIPQTPVEIVVLDEPEAIELGELVARMFSRANWPIVKAQKTVLWFPTTNGLHLEVTSLPGPDCSAPIVRAFADLGIDDVRILVPERLPEEGSFRIFVGRKIPR